MTGEVGTIYFIHFERPLAHARHYVGWTSDLQRRLSEHQSGRGARLMQAVRAAGIGWSLVKIQPGTRDEERAIKNKKSTPRLCPICVYNGDRPK